MLPRCGDVLLLTRSASPQFVHPIMFRFTRVVDSSTCPDGWAWLDGYQLNSLGDAIERRTLFVYLPGIRPAKDPVRPTPEPGAIAAHPGLTNQRRGGTMRQRAGAAR